MTVEHGNDATGTIVTFYSYKGGTGRTMSLANVAWILAANGKRVLAVDWDLDSPGLQRFYHPFLSPSVLASASGVIDLIVDYAWKVHQVDDDRPADWYREAAQVMPHVVSLNWQFPDGGTLDFRPAGRQNRDYTSAMAPRGWDDFYEEMGGGLFFQAMREDMKENYDYVLIDSRTGLSDIADICTVQLPDILVNCFALSDQNIDGAANVARRIRDHYRDRRIRILPVPMRVDEAEKEKADAGRALVASKFAGFPVGMEEERRAQYWAQVEIPYRPFYAYEETLATFGDSAGLPTSLLAAFERLTTEITSGRVTGLPPIDDQRRKRILEDFTRRQPTKARLQIHYIPEDRMWADWMREILSQVGIGSDLMRAGTAGRARDESGERRGDDSQKILSVVSQAYLRSPEVAADWNHPRMGGRQAVAHRIIPIRTADVRLTDPYLDNPAVDLARLTEPEAVEALLRTVDRAAYAQWRARSPESIPSSRAQGPRFPGADPRVWNVRSRNAQFTGRDDVLERLRDMLLSSSVTAVLPQALHGLGGVGKTQVALEYAHRFKGDYDLIWWLSAEQPDLIATELADLARPLGVRVGENVAEAATQVLETLRRGEPHNRWLLIFDNADDPNDLKAFLPEGRGHVLITSRNPAWSQEAAPFEVDVFDRRESVEHLQRRVPGMSEEDADAMAAALGDLPLAIEQAGAWLAETGIPASTYIDELAQQATEVLALNQPADYPLPVATTWNISFQLLKERSPAAVRLLELCSFLAPEPISMTLLRRDEMLRALIPYDDTLRDKMMLGRVIREIGRFALAKVDTASNSLQVHRLVQTVVRAQLSADEQERACHEVHRVLVGARPDEGDTDDPDNWPRYNEIWPHLVPSRARDCSEEQTLQLLIDRVRYMWKRGELDRALSYGRELEGLWRAERSETDRNTLSLRFHLANVLWSMGRFDEALEVNTEVLAMQLDTLGPNHRHTLMTASGRAAALRALGRFAEALAADEETYATFAETFGSDFPQTLSSANNLAISYRLVGDFQKAASIDQNVWETRSEILGQKHPYTLSSAASLARDLLEAGEFGRAVDILRDTLAKCREALGDDFVDTLRTAKSLAVALRKAGELAEAEQLTQTTYQTYLDRFGPNHPDTLACSLNLAADLSARDADGEAFEVMTACLAAYENSLGPEHPYTMVAVNNLALYTRAAGHPARGRALADRALAGFRSTLGEEHPFTLIGAMNLANCLGDLGELETAEELERKTVAVLRKRLGEVHPDTLVAEANHAVTLKAGRRGAEAQNIVDRVLPGLVNALGTEHPTTQRVRNGRRVGRDLEPSAF